VIVQVVSALIVQVVCSRRKASERSALFRVSPPLKRGPLRSALVVCGEADKRDRHLIIVFFGEKLNPPYLFEESQILGHLHHRNARSAALAYHLFLHSKLSFP